MNDVERGKPKTAPEDSGGSIQRTNSPDPCDDYACERPDEGHTHVGALPHLRRVVRSGVVIDGLTGLPL
jgi:hypothetical protein